MQHIRVPGAATHLSKCDANGAPNSEQPAGRSCKLFLCTEKRCVYDLEGRLKDIATKTVGACL